MSLTLNEKDKRSLAALIQARMEEHISRFPFARYPIEPVEEWKRIFYDPISITPTTLKQSLSWHFGSWQRKDLALAHRKVISTIVVNWSEYIKNPYSLTDSLQFWQQKLPNWKTGFNAVAFLLHLTRPDSIELVDHHRLQAMTELLKEIKHKEAEQTFSLTLTDLECYSSFFRAVMPKLPFGLRNRILLDRFLKAYGNRCAYKNTHADYRTIEPEITTFSWNSFSAKHFDLTKITLRSNADILFACLLLSLDSHPNTLDGLTIGQIIERLPLGTANICNPASFNYAMIALFGNQKGRDYIHFENSTLTEAFTKQANQSTRNMRFYIHHSSERAILNPKYLRI
ncbi:hypothetical protein PaecuDRAFT_3580 [Paenibacillus curdlanolyticus YK9]|uniref:Uncharacterized protein n=1 Tax=Paenibacillus curdlanolyticus YK9 TaxID=717606 RepID=E0ID78_9BACL|nr:hypothetical protein [Paenibacillus curdlanolyticus]EFM09533.1 hypothetical protein PaecuDRAFT_3580 [Paenibacillus curdlanolyticus YK9]